MEMVFANPSHRAALEDMGVLAKDQGVIQIKDFVQKVMETGKVGSAIDILRQEVATYLQGLFMVDEGMDDVEREVDEVNNIETFEAASEDLLNMEVVLYRSIVQTDLLVETAFEIKERAMNSDELRPLLADSVNKDLEFIQKARNTTQEILEKDGKNYIRKFELLQNSIDLLRDKYYPRGG